MREFKYRIAIYSLTGLISLLYIGFLTNGIPFFWCDFDLLRHALNLNISFTKMFHPGPITMFIAQIIYKISGLDINIFRLFKDALFLVTVLLIVKCTYRISKSWLSSIFSGLFFMASPSILKTTIWICDFELLTQAFLIVALLFYIESVRKILLPWSIFTLLSFFLAAQTTNGARLFPLVVGLDLIFAKDGNRAKRLILLIALFLISILGTRLPLNTSHYSFSLANIKEQLYYLIKTDSYIVGPSFVLSLFFLWRTKDRFLQVISFWFWISLISQLFYQRTDFQFAYQVVIFVPLAITILSGFSLFLRQLSKQKGFLLGSISGLFIFSAVFSNLMLSNHYRGAWGSLFIAMGEATEYIDKNIEHAIIVYQSVTPDLQTFALNKNRYLNTEGIDTTEKLETKLQAEIKKVNYKNVYLVSHSPDIPKLVDKIPKKTLIVVLEGKNKYLYDRLKEIYRAKTKSADTPNQFTIYLYK